MYVAFIVPPCGISGYFIKNHIYPNIEKNADSFIKFKNDLNFSKSRPSKKSLLFTNPKMKNKVGMIETILTLAK